MTTRTGCKLALVGLLVLAATLSASPVANASHPNSCAVGRDVKPSSYNHTWITQTWHYRIIRSSLPASSERRQNAFIARIRRGVRQWNTGQPNWCGFSRFTEFRTAFDGDSGSNGGDNSDGISTIDFTAGDPCGRDVLGCHTARRSAATYKTRAGYRYRALESDIRWRRNRPWFVRAGYRGCNNQYDLRSTAAHEVGHAVGLGDTYDDAKNNGNIMGQGAVRCDSGAGKDDPEFHRRRLGRADWIGLRDLYTFADD